MWPITSRLKPELRPLPISNLGDGWDSLLGFKATRSLALPVLSRDKFWHFLRLTTQL